MLILSLGTTSTQHGLRYPSLQPLPKAMAAASAPPVAHAIGGSLGSAFALLLFYPLERARIQLQSEVSRSTNQIESNPELLESVDAQVGIDKTDSIPSSSEGSSSAWIPLNQEQQELQPQTTNLTEKSDGLSPSWDMESSSSSSESLSLTPASRQKKQTLVQCLAQLHARNELYKGAAPVVSTIVVSQFVFFYIHAVVKKLLKNSLLRNSSKTVALSLLSSCLAGLLNVLLTNPLWVVNMAIVTGESKTSNLWKELFTMIKERGPKHMWNGTSASVLLVSNPVIQFFCYEQMKVSRTLSPKRSVLPPVEAFIIGAMAKGIATVTTYPLQLAQTVLRLKDNKYKGTVDCLLKLYKEGGIEKLFTGMRAKLLQTVLTAAFTFLTYEQILSVVQATLIKGG